MAADMSASWLELDRERILAHRQRVGALDARLPRSADSLRAAAWAGVPDSMPRAALHSLHARVEAADGSIWEDPSLVQVWGPRYSVHVVAEPDAAVFTLGRLPDDEAGRRRAIATADRLEAFLGGRRMSYAEAGHAVGVHPNALRYATTTGRVRIRWEGARRPLVWTVPAPAIAPEAAATELARRYLHVRGPGTAAGFAAWAGIRPPRARAIWGGLATELLEVRTVVGEAAILASDEASFTAPPGPAAPARLLPSGDTYVLCWGADRGLLVPDPRHRSELWTPRVWPGALLVAGEIAGTWRRADRNLTISPWRPLLGAEREAVEAEAASLPLPDAGGPTAVRWEA